MRLGLDLGGTKIEIIALDKGREVLRERIATPSTSYDDTIRAMRDLVRNAEAKLGRRGSVGVAIPGALSPVTGLVKNANSTRLIGHPLDRDLGAALSRPVRAANDANCFVLSEASDGAATGFDIAFGIIEMIVHARCFHQQDGSSDLQTIAGIRGHRFGEQLDDAVEHGRSLAQRLSRCNSRPTEPGTTRHG